MEKLKFSLSKERREDEWICHLHISDPLFPKRQIDFAYLREKAGKCDKKNALLRLLQKEIGKGGYALDSTKCSRIPVREHKSWELVQLLAKAKLLKSKERELFVDPLGNFKVEFSFDDDGEALIVQGSLVLASKKIPIAKCDFLFPGDPSWVIAEGVVRQIDSSVQPKWLRMIDTGEKLLEGKEREKWIDLFDEGVFPGSPMIVWAHRAKEKEDLPLPVLELTDRTGGFANLLMQYQKRRISIEDRSSTERSIEMEKIWEDELLEDAFMKKRVGGSLYYCPLDRVVPALSRLLEKGWTIINREGKEIVRQEKLTPLELKLDREMIAVEGEAHFGDQEVEIDKVLRSLANKEHFLSLSEGKVALLDRTKVEEELGEAAEEVIQNRGKIPKCRFGLFASLLAKDEVASTDLSSLARFIREGREVPTVGVGSSFVGTLHPYQQEGVDWLSFLYEMNLNGLLADEMGLGKTVQVLGFLSQLPQTARVLIIAPTSLLFNWKREFATFIPNQKVYVHSGSDRLKSVDDQQVIITSYALLRRDRDLLSQFAYDVIVLDEAQTIKNPDSQIAQYACQLEGKMRICLSGTPVENRPDDLWSLYRFLVPGLLGERREFAADVSLAEQVPGIWKRIEKKIAPFLLRRTKEVIADQLPPLFEQNVWIEMSDEQRTCYEQLLQARKGALLDKISQDGIAKHKMEVLEVILRLRQICVHPALANREWEDTQSQKLERILSDLEEILASGEKVLIYSQFVEMLQILSNSLKERGVDFAYLDGQTKNREAEVMRFREEKDLQVFLISLKAGGVGLNLPEADYVLLVDPWWNEAVERQAIDRAHRLGRKSQVIARRYLTVSSIEEKISLLKEAKGKMIEQMIDGNTDLFSLSNNDLEDLLA